jgi:acyl carrier protein
LQCYLPREEATERVTKVLQSMKQLQGRFYDETFSLDSKFADHRFDELDVEEMAKAVSSAFCIEVSESAAAKLATPNDVIELIATHPQAK